MIEKERPISAEKAKAAAGTVNNPSKTNAAADKLAGNLGNVGTALTVASAGVSVYNIATSNEPVKQTVKEGFSWAGAIAMGQVFAETAAPFGPVASFVAGLVGSSMGGALGNATASGMMSKPDDSKKNIPAEHFNQD
jgi:hypothetical protein